MTNADLDERLSELLLHYGVLSHAALDRARSFHTGGPPDPTTRRADPPASAGHARMPPELRHRATLAGVLLDLHLVDEQTLKPLLEELTGARAVDPRLLTVYPDFVERMNVLIPPDVVSALLVFPVQMEVNTIHVCMVNPTDGRTAGALEALSGCRITPAVAHEAALSAAIEAHYGAALAHRPAGDDGGRLQVAEDSYRALLERSFDIFLTPAVALVNRNFDRLQRDDEALTAVIRDPATIRLVQQILCRAIEMGASDIHIEPTGEALRVRARIDGTMRVLHTLTPNAAGAISARLKAMAELPSHHRSSEPVDARIGYQLVWGREIDLRVSAVPTVTGEKIVLRVLDRTQGRRGLGELGMDSRTQRLIESSVDLPNGLILVTGPTGSGKSSTLYALVDRLNDESLAIVTAEDPVESRIAGVAQVQCGQDSHLSYVAALRSFLRQDPDVMMIGEIRDAETADTALKAALTGHLVLSTLHTNDAPGAVLRLLNMSLEPFIIASALRCIIAQRLVRRLCRACKRPMEPEAEPRRRLLAHLSSSSQRLLEGSALFDAVGCHACGGTGYAGRVGIFEVLRMAPAIEELIITRGPASAIRAAARAAGMRTLRDAGLCQVAAGETTIAEVLEHTTADDEEVSRNVARTTSIPA